MNSSFATKLCFHFLLFLMKMFTLWRCWNVPRVFVSENERQKMFVVRLEKKTRIKRSELSEKFKTFLHFGNAGECITSKCFCCCSLVVRVDKVSLKILTEIDANGTFYCCNLMDSCSVSLIIIIKTNARIWMHEATCVERRQLLISHKYLPKSAPKNISRQLWLWSDDEDRESAEAFVLYNAGEISKR